MLTCGKKQIDRIAHELRSLFVQHFLLQGDLIHLVDIHDIPILVEGYQSVDDLLGLAALLVRQQISVAFEAIPHEGRVVGCANEVRVRLAGRLPVLVAHDARLTQSKQTSETLLRQAVLPSNALDVLSRQILRHESSYQSFDW